MSHQHNHHDPTTTAKKYVDNGLEFSERGFDLYPVSLMGLIYILFPSWDCRTGLQWSTTNLDKFYWFRNWSYVSAGLSSITVLPGRNQHHLGMEEVQKDQSQNSCKENPRNKLCWREPHSSDRADTAKWLDSGVTMDKTSCFVLHQILHLWNGNNYNN